MNDNTDGVASYEYVKRFFNSLFPSDQTRVEIDQLGPRDIRVTLTDIRTGKRKEIFTGPSTKVSDLHDKAFGAARVLNYEWVE